jgi:hypothetical protein
MYPVTTLKAEEVVSGDKLLLGNRWLAVVNVQVGREKVVIHLVSGVIRPSKGARVRARLEGVRVRR